MPWAPPSHEQLPLSLGYRQEAALKEPLGRDSSHGGVLSPRARGAAVHSLGFGAPQRGHFRAPGAVVATASSSLPDSWFRSISAGPLEGSGVSGLLGAS